MSQLQELKEVFETFATFGSNRNLASLDSLDGSQIDNAKFAKFCRDTKIVDKKCTMIDVDIFFNKCKTKGARKLNFDQFQQSLRLLAEKKYSEKAPLDAYKTLVAHILRNRDPIAHATVAQTTGIYDRLLYDQSTYSATHRNRINGVPETEAALTKTFSSMVDRQNNGTFVKRNRGVVGLSTESLNNGSSAKKADIRTSTEKLSERKVVVAAANKSKTNLASQSLGSKSGSLNNLATSKAKSKSNGDIFSRLTDSTLYTGTHKHRFNADGTGRGLAGRDSVPLGRTPGPYRGGQVHDLSQILRN